MLTGSALLVAIAAAALAIFLTRALPFLIFARKKPPPFVQFLDKQLPPLIMAILLVYCLKDVHFMSAPHGIPHIAALAFTVAAHLWKRNPLLSIGGGTVLYMVLSRLLS
jgi:branched-subunit amino acid transport protein AzlD